MSSSVIDLIPAAPSDPHPPSLSDPPPSSVSCGRGVISRVTAGPASPISPCGTAIPHHRCRAQPRHARERAQTTTHVHTHAHAHASRASVRNRQRTRTPRSEVNHVVHQAVPFVCDTRAEAVNHAVRLYLTPSLTHTRARACKLRHRQGATTGTRPDPPECMWPDRAAARRDQDFCIRTLRVQTIGRQHGQPDQVPHVRTRTRVTRTHARTRTHRGTV